ncbi:hypothetical protein LPJ66_006667 [Kickxella alabastrina]|uniref:Uncharacterized protein n=1 Tax=Kickxella alabastrina TaxID=61397 RepID=A0ACC1IBM7_9FUNG|nr:hypothetical protein LPJ66_006667 [Kickxella alabastrina]
MSLCLHFRPNTSKAAAVIRQTLRRRNHTKSTSSTAEAEASAATATATASGNEQVIFTALPGNAVRLLKFMSVAGSTLACTATAMTAVTQSQGKLSDNDLGVFSLGLASTISLASTLAVSKLFGPFVTRITLRRAKTLANVQRAKSGLPRFDSLLKNAKAGVTGDTEVVLQTPGLLGFNSRHTKVKVNDLVASSLRFRTWEMEPSAVAARRERGERTPVTTFTILWKSLHNSPNKNIMQEINVLIGGKT